MHLGGLARELRRIGKVRKQLGGASVEFSITHHQELARRKPGDFVRLGRCERPLRRLQERLRRRGHFRLSFFRAELAKVLGGWQGKQRNVVDPGRFARAAASAPAMTPCPSIHQVSWADCRIQLSAWAAVAWRRSK